MTQRERQILQLIEADPMISQQTIADELGITRSSVAVHISNLMSKGHIAGRGYVLRRLLRRAARRPNEADSPAKIARCKEMLALLLEKTDSLCF